MRTPVLLLLLLLAVAGLALALTSPLLWLHFGPTSTPTASAGATTIDIAAANFWFCDSSFQNGTCETKINVGDTVRWNFSGSLHTSTSSGNWSSGTQASGTSFSFQFNDAGEFNYRCNFHPTQMNGTIIVNGGAPTATPPSPTATPVTPSPTSPPSPTPTLTGPATATPTNTPATPSPTPPPTNTPPGPGHADEDAN